MTITFSPDALADLRKIKRKDKVLYHKLEKQLLLFSKNPKHPSLRIHKLTGKLHNSWSLSVSHSHRLVYLMQKEGIFIVGIGTHDQIYKK